jgi:hypothetical protein
MAEVRERSLLDRIVGIARLDAATFEEIEHDESATLTALTIAGLAGVSIGIGIGIFGSITGEFSGPTWFIASILTYVVLGMTALVAFVAVAYVVGGFLLKAPETDVTFGELFRTLGFAGVLIVALGWLAIMFEPIFLIVLVYFLAAVVIAVRQSMDFSTGRAIATALAATLSVVVPLVLLFVLAAAVT